MMHYNGRSASLEADFGVNIQQEGHAFLSLVSNAFENNFAVRSTKPLGFMQLLREAMVTWHTSIQTPSCQKWWS